MNILVGDRFEQRVMRGQRIVLHDLDPRATFEGPIHARTVAERDVEVVDLQKYSGDCLAGRGRDGDLHRARRRWPTAAAPASSAAGKQETLLDFDRLVPSSDPGKAQRRGGMTGRALSFAIEVRRAGSGVARQDVLGLKEWR